MVRYIGWFNMLGSWPGIADNNARAPPAELSGPLNDPTSTAASTPHPHLADIALENTVIKATQVIFGAFLAVCGVMAIIMHGDPADAKFEWTQLVGPVLVLSGTCIFIAGVYACGRCLMFRDTKQPVMLQGGSPMLCKPPPYNLVIQQAHQASEVQPASSVNDAQAAERSGSQMAADEKGSHDDTASTCSQPPAYEEIAPKTQEECRIQL